MSKVKAYITDCYSELMTKVSWPTWNDLQSNAIVVLVAALIISLIVFVMDLAFQGSMNIIYSIFD